MKKIIARFFIICSLFLCLLFAQPALADNPPPPPGHGTTGNVPGGGGAIGGGLLILLVLGVGYGAKVWYDARKRILAE